MSLSQRLQRPSSKLDIDLPITTSTTLYITVTAELRGDCDVYMFGFDKCFTTVEQANARIDLLGRCNVNPKINEMKLTHIEAETGCFCVTWTQDQYASRPRFLAQAKKVDMLGSIPQVDGSAVSPGGWHKKDSTHFDATFVLDKKDHVWVVAIHEPPSSMGSSSSLLRRASTSMSHGRGERYSYYSSAGTLGSQSAEHKQDMNEQDSGWTVHSVHSSSDHAVAQAKRAWNLYFRDKGRCKKDSRHIAFGRHTFRPALMNERDSGLEKCLQIRVERMKVVSKYDNSMDLISKKVLERLKVLMPVPTNPGSQCASGKTNHPDQKQSHRRGKLANISRDHRSSFIEGLCEIANQAFKDNFNYGEVGLALNIRSDALQHFGLEGQRYGIQVKESDSIADLYHATLRGSDQKKTFTRDRVSESFLRAQKRMNEAARDLDPLVESGSSFAWQTSSVSSRPSTPMTVAINAHSNQPAALSAIWSKTPPARSIGLSPSHRSTSTTPSRTLTPTSSSLHATATQPNMPLGCMEGDNALHLVRAKTGSREVDTVHVLCERFCHGYDAGWQDDSSSC